jgi:hypothetical protein
VEPVANHTAQTEKKSKTPYPHLMRANISSPSPVVRLALAPPHHTRSFHELVHGEGLWSALLFELMVYNLVRRCDMTIIPSMSYGLGHGSMECNELQLLLLDVYIP